MVFFDCILYFNVGYYKKGIIIKDRKSIIFHYLKKLFWINLIGVFVVFLDTITTGNIFDYIYSLFLIKIYNIY